MNNKEVMGKLKDYFLTQDPSIVAEALASAMIDFNRVASFNEIPENEREILRIRINLTVAQLQDFILKGGAGSMKIIKMNSSDLQ